MIKSLFKSIKELLHRNKNLIKVVLKKLYMTLYKHINYIKIKAKLVKFYILQMKLL